MKVKTYTKEEIQFIKDNYLKLDYYQIAKKLNRSYGSVASKIIRLQLPLKITPWKMSDLKFLKENLKNKGIEFCMNSLGRTRQAIISKYKYIG